MHNIISFYICTFGSNISDLRYIIIARYVISLYDESIERRYNDKCANNNIIEINEFIDGCTYSYDN